MQVTLRFLSPLNIRLPIVRAIKTLNSCEDDDYRCFGVVRCNFHGLASILGNVRQAILLFVEEVGVNHVTRVKHK